MNQDNKGFTLVELMLAMAFVAALLIAIAMMVIQIGNIYNRGLTLKEVNQSGLSLSNELQRNIAENASFTLTTNYVAQDWGGRLCVGRYSYVWNYGEDIYNKNTSLNKYTVGTNVIRFIKIYDSDASYCKTPSKKIVEKDAIELVNIGEHDLAIHDFFITTNPLAIDSTTGQSLYSISFTIGTNKKDTFSTDINTGEITCKAPGEASADLTYCSINEFNIVARSGNAVK